MSSAEEQHHVAEERQPEAVEGLQEHTEHVEEQHAADEEQHHEHHEEEHVHEEAAADDGAPHDEAQAAQQQQEDATGRGAMTEFLATLNMPGISQISPEQIENFLAAARANGTASDASAQAPAATTEDSNLGNVLANLPPHLGQAASALTDLNKQPANSAEHVEEQHVGEAEQDQEAARAEAGEEEQQHAEGAEEQQAEQDHHHQQQQQDVGELKEEHHHATAEEHHYEQSDHDASAAALAGLAAAEGGLIGPDGEPVAGSPTPSGRNKKATGPEAERMRKDNHKEVERKRRAHISEGISRLSALIPGYDSKSQNKGAIIMSAADYIQDLKDNEASNIEKWTLEKLLMDQAMGDLQAAVESLRRENERLRAELGLPEPEEGHEDEQQQQQQHAEGEEAQQDGEEAYTHAEEDHGAQEAVDETGVAPKAGGSINDDALKEIAEAAAAASNAAAAGEEGQQEEGHHEHHAEAHEEHAQEHVEEHPAAVEADMEEDVDTGAGKVRTHDEMEHDHAGGVVVEADVEADGASRAKRSKLA